VIFLIQYNRESGRLVTMRSFDDSEREIAHETRLDLELELNEKGVGDEVVLLEAATEEAIRRTHRRYFEDLHELTSRMPGLDLVHSS
jgi:hypothetical protein